MSVGFKGSIRVIVMMTMTVAEKGPLKRSLRGFWEFRSVLLLQRVSPRRVITDDLSILRLRALQSIAGRASLRLL